jgi:hypothetical protein
MEYVWAVPRDKFGTAPPASTPPPNALKAPIGTVNSVFPCANRAIPGTAPSASPTVAQLPAPMASTGTALPVYALLGRFGMELPAFHPTALLITTGMGLTAFRLPRLNVLQATHGTVRPASASTNVLQATPGMERPASAPINVLQATHGTERLALALINATTPPAPQASNGTVNPAFGFVLEGSNGTECSVSAPTGNTGRVPSAFPALTGRHGPRLL